jgi:hypothetical protein
VPNAQVQVQKQGRNELLRNLNTDGRGQFKLRGLRPGRYWLGISISGFNLHYLRLTITRSGGDAKVRIPLSLGT